MIGATTGQRGEGSVEGFVAEAVIDLDAIAHNVALLAERALMDGDHPSSLMAVVKADAFGHGLIPVSQAALKSGATWLGVTSVGEALAVRGAGIDAPMLAWLYGTDDDSSPRSRPASTCRSPRCPTWRASSTRPSSAADRRSST